MSAVAHHLVRRAVDITNDHYASTSPDHEQGDDRLKRLATWGIVLLWATFILYFAMISAINYTYGNVVATLTMIETPTATAYAAISADGEPAEVDAPLLSDDELSEKQKLKAMEQDLFLVKQPPITGKLRTAVKHLRAVGGRLGRFRGFQVALIYHIAHGMFTHIVSGGNRFSPLRPVATLLATLALFRVDMLWTHIVMSSPSSKRWYQRFVKLNCAKGIIIATLVCTIAQELAVYLPAAFGRLAAIRYAQSHYSENPDMMQKLAIGQSIVAVLMGIISIFLVIIPAQVTLTRVQASMLSDEDETIVPFDRSFGGRKTPEIVSGKGSVGMTDAWRSFDKAGRIRLIKLYLKVVAIQVVTTIFFIMTMIGELRLIMGDDFNKAIRNAKKGLGVPT